MTVGAPRDTGNRDVLAGPNGRVVAGWHDAAAGRASDGDADAVGDSDGVGVADSVVGLATASLALGDGVVRSIPRSSPAPPPSPPDASSAPRTPTTATRATTASGMAISRLTCVSPLDATRATGSSSLLGSEGTSR